MFDVKVESKSVTDALQRLAKSAANPRPVLLAIAEDLVTSTKKRFVTSTAPDGTRWAPNKPSTLRRKKGDKPLIGKTNLLSQKIFPDVGSDWLVVGSPMKYAAMQHFGGKKSQFPKLWGDIAARPIFGLSDSDEKMVVSTTSDYLRSTLR